MVLTKGLRRKKMRHGLEELLFEGLVRVRNDIVLSNSIEMKP